MIIKQLLFLGKMLLKKTNYNLADNERLDDLIINGMKIFQNEKQFCFSLDAILLAHFAFLKTKAKCIDLGTGTGVIPLLLAARGATDISAIELNPIMVELAKKSVKYNDLESIIKIFHADLREVSKEFTGGNFDMVVSNPPYRPIDHGKMSEIDGLAMARHEITANLRDVVRAAKYLLKFRGRFAMVHLPERLSEIMVEMSQIGIEPKRLQLVYPMIGKKPNMILIEGIVGANPGLIVEEPLIVYKDDGSYEDAILNYYKK